MGGFARCSLKLEAPGLLQVVRLFRQGRMIEIGTGRSRLHILHLLHYSCLASSTNYSSKETGKTQYAIFFSLII